MVVLGEGAGIFHGQRKHSGRVMQVLAIGSGSGVDDNDKVGMGTRG